MPRGDAPILLCSNELKASTYGDMKLKVGTTIKFMNEEGKKGRLSNNK